MKRRLTVIAVALLVAAVGWPPLARHGDEVQARAVWNETPWPFPMDQWGKGKAYRCKSADCGTEIVLYLRPKLGSCDCTAGVADDEALDRMSDFDLLGGASSNESGRSIVVGHMKGRSRFYALNRAGKSGRSAVAIAFNDRCDMIVATALMHDSSAKLEREIIEFLNGRTVLPWVERVVGL